MENIDLTINEEFYPEVIASSDALVEKPRMKPLRIVIEGDSDLLGESTWRKRLNDLCMLHFFHIDLFGSSMEDPDANPSIMCGLDRCDCCGISLTPLNRVYSLCERCAEPRKNENILSENF